MLAYPTNYHSTSMPDDCFMEVDPPFSGDVEPGFQGPVADTSGRTVSFLSSVGPYVRSASMESESMDWEYTEAPVSDRPVLARVATEAPPTSSGKLDLALSEWQRAQIEEDSAVYQQAIDSLQEARASDTTAQPLLMEAIYEYAEFLQSDEDESPDAEDIAFVINALETHCQGEEKGRILVKHFALMLEE